MRKLGIILSLCMAFIFFSLNTVSAATVDIPKEVQKAAKESMKFVKQEIAADPEIWGFSKNDNLDKLKLGEGYNLYYINGEKLRNSTSDSILDISFKSDIWQYIIYLDRQPKMYLSIGKEDGVYRMVQMGGKAQDLDTALNNFNELSAEDISTKTTSVESIGSKPIIVKSESKYLLVSKSDGEEKVLPALSAEKAKLFNNMDYTEFSNSRDVIKVMKEKLKDSNEEIKLGGSDNSNKTTWYNSTLNSVIIITIALAVAASVILYRRKFSAGA